MNSDMHLGPLIRRLNKEFEQLHREKAEALGLTPVQLFVLHYLAGRRDENVCLRDIEKKFELTHATVSGIISRLESKGFITCSSAENDKRFKNICITEKARCCENEMKKHIERYETQLVSGFSEEERTLLFEFVRRLLKNVDVKLPDKGEKEEKND